MHGCWFRLPFTDGLDSLVKRHVSSFILCESSRLADGSTIISILETTFY